MAALVIMRLCIAVIIAIYVISQDNKPEHWKITDTFLNDEGIMIHVDSDSYTGSFVLSYEEVNKLNDTIVKGGFNKQ